MARLILAVLVVSVLSASQLMAEVLPSSDVGQQILNDGGGSDTSSVTKLEGPWGNAQTGPVTIEVPKAAGITTVDTDFPNSDTSFERKSSESLSEGSSFPAPVLNHISGVYESKADSKRADEDIKRITDVNTVKEITYRMTEPAVGEAAKDALMLAYLDDMDRKASHEALLSTLDRLGGEWGENLTLSYLNCIVKKGKNGESWRTAQSACVGDIYPTANKKFEIAAAGKGFTIEDHPSVTANTSGEPITLKRLMFDPRIKAGGGGAETELWMKLRRDFELMVGDLKIEYAPDAFDPKTWKPTITEQAPAKNVEVVRVEREKKVYEELIKLFKERCGKRTTTHVPFDKGQKTYWETLASDKYTLISIPQMPPNAMYLNIMYGLFMAKDASQDPQCNTIFGDRVSYNTVFKPASSSTKPLPYEAQVLRYFTEKTVKGQMLDSFSQMEQVLISLARSGNPLALKGLALLNNRAGATADRTISQKYQLVIDDVTVFFQRLAQKAKQKSGSQSLNVTESFASTSGQAGTGILGAS